MKGLKRTHRCTEISTANIGENVTLMGWVQKSRNKGGIIFVDLRDRSGIMQLIFENGSIDEEGFAKAGKLRSEFVIAVTGVVEERGGAVNKNLATGEIELRVKSLRDRFVWSEFNVLTLLKTLKMKTKKYIFIAAAASMLGMTTSCDDEGFLTEKPKTIYTTDNSYETIDQVKACITNLYIHIRYWYQQDYFLKGLGTDVLDTPYFRSTGNGYCNFANWSSTNKIGRAHV